MSSSPPLAPASPSPELALVADASVEGELLAAELRALDLEVVDAPLLSLRARVAEREPTLVVLDVDAPQALALAEELLERHPGVLLVALGGPAALPAPASARAPLGPFGRPIDVDEVVAQVRSALPPRSAHVGATRGAAPSAPPPGPSAPPSEPSAQRPPSAPPSAALTPMPSALTSAPSLFPPADSLPPPSGPARGVDALELGAVDADDDLLLMENMIGAAIELSPELASRIEAAERRVRPDVDAPSNQPPPSSDDPAHGAQLPPELLAMLDEPLDPSADLPNPSEAGQSALHGLSSQAPGTAAGTPAGHGTGVPPGTSSGTESGAGQFAPRGTSAGGGTSGGPSTRTGIEAMLGGSATSLFGTSARAVSEPPGPAAPAPDPPGSEPGTHVGLGGSHPPLRSGGALAIGGGAAPAEPSLSPRAESPATGYRLGELLGLARDGAFQGRTAPESEARREGVIDTLRGDDPGLLGSLSPPVRFREPRALGGGRAAPSIPATAEPGDDGAPSAPPPQSPANLPVDRALTDRPAPDRDVADRPVTDRNVAPIDLRTSPRAQSVASPTRETSSAMPAVFGEAEGLRPIARAIVSRLTGSLAMSTPSGLRRVILQEGDLVTVGSDVADEHLVSFLASRGDLGRETAARLAGKLPPSGRHAGAALIAQGLLAQDDLWPVLRAHAEWLLGRAMLAGPGSVTLEDEAPGRLRAEPGVFGGATGAEVFVEAARRVLTPDASRAALGGGDARLEAGPKANLLSECALATDEDARVRAAAGRPLHEICEGLDADFVSALRALVELQIVELRAPARPDATPARASHDPLDDEAIERRVATRLALVQEGDYFALLGLSPEATAYDIKRAYLELRRQFEPGRLLTAATAALAPDVTLIAEVLDEAYDVLRDAQRRERYRRAILAGPPG